MNASKSSVVESTITWPMQNQAVLWTQPDFTGYLEKCMDNYWQNFFFVLQGSFLFYFTNDIGVNTTLPLGVIPVEGCKLQISRRETEENLEKFAFVLGISSQYAILAKHGTYVLAALSQEALDEWIEKLSKAANSRTQLFGELRKIRAKVGKFRILLPKLPLFHKLLASVQGVEAKKLQAELAEVRKEIMALQIQAKQVRAECDQEEMKISKALVTWDVVFQYASGEIKGETCNTIERLKYQAKILKDLYELMQSKGNILQGEGLEKLSQDARTQLHDILQRAVDIIQERHAKICSKAPNYSREIDPKIYELNQPQHMTIHQPNAVEQASQNKEQDLPIQDPQGALQYINEVENLTVKHGTIDTEQKFNIAGESQLNKEVVASASTSKSSYDNAQPKSVSQSTFSMLPHEGTNPNTEPNTNRRKVSWNDSVTEINSPSGHMFDSTGNPEIVSDPLGTHEMSMKDQTLLASITPPPHDRSQATREGNSLSELSFAITRNKNLTEEKLLSNSSISISSKFAPGSHGNKQGNVDEFSAASDTTRDKVPNNASQLKFPSKSTASDESHMNQEGLMDNQRAARSAISELAPGPLHNQAQNSKHPTSSQLKPHPNQASNLATANAGILSLHKTLLTGWTEKQQTSQEKEVLPRSTLHMPSNSQETSLPSMQTSEAAVDQKGRMVAASNLTNHERPQAPEGSATTPGSDHGSCLIQQATIKQSTADSIPAGSQVVPRQRAMMSLTPLDESIAANEDSHEQVKRIPIPITAQSKNLNSSEAKMMSDFPTIQSNFSLNQATAGLGETQETMQSKSDEAPCIFKSPQQSKGHSEPDKIETTILSESTALDSHLQGIVESNLAAIPKVPTHKSGAIQQTATQRNDIERSPLEQSERFLLEQSNITHRSAQPTAPSGTKTVSTEGHHPALLETNLKAFPVKFQTTEESTEIDANQDLQSEHQHAQLLHRKHASAQQHVLSTQHSAFSTTAEGNVHLPRLRSSLSRGGNDPFLDEIQATTDPSRPSHNQDSTSHTMQEGSKISDRNLPLQNLEIGSQSRDFGQIGTAIDGARHAPPHPLNQSHQSHDADIDVKTTGNVNPLPDHDTSRSMSDDIKQVNFLTVPQIQSALVKTNMADRRSSMKGQTLHLSPTAIIDNPRTINLGKNSRYLSKENLDSSSPRQDISTASTSDAKFNRKEYKAKLSDLVNRKGPIVVYQDFNCVPVNQPSPTKPGD
ncbi:hypothetical protein O6H91_03G110200 [Diphasiastrum complanatum]|uniref:Uncharacterized protein n=1 Tax=Diphasiastrum complanatum TaxID=34168 RepID=A0ACC2EAF8_DIPCM|nr:hypothetical protein O6H91_03G110200 [Diphasiastrum complanatum]